MKIRNFRKTDLGKILEFKRASAKISFPRKKIDTRGFRKRLLLHSREEAETVRVVEEDDAVIGYIWFSIEKSNLGRYGIIHHVFVDDSFRGRGLAKKLMKIAEGYFKSKGIKRIKVTITLTNTPSIRMCENLGYKRNRVIMEKFL